MVDKLFFCGEPMALRCFFKNLPMLCSILIGPLFCQGFYTKDGLDFPLAHGHRSVRPTRLGLSGLVFCFYPLQLPPSPHLVRRFLRKGANWGDGQINADGSMFIGRRMRYKTWTATNLSLDDDCKYWVDGVTINKVTVWTLAVGDEDPWMTVYGVWGRQGYRGLTRCPEAFKAYDTCRSSIGLYLGLKCRFVFRALHL